MSLLSRGAFVDLGATRIAYRRVGSGPPLLMLHGWPFTSATYRALSPLLADRFTCFLPDSPGMGETEWTDATRFDFPSQARTFAAFLDALELRDGVFVLAHDTGATIARLLAADDARVRKLAMLNTEMPGHRPPWLPLYQRLLGVPGMKSAFRVLLRSSSFLRSPMGFGGCFHDPKRLDDAFVDAYIAPLLRDPRRLEGALRYFAGLEWSLIDELAEIHGRITIPVRMIYGADDRTFPVSAARASAPQLPAFDGLDVIGRARLLVHEERPDEVAAAAIAFFER